MRGMPQRPATVADLTRRFASVSGVRFEPGPGGLVRVVVHAAQADAVIYLHGAHVAEFRPAGFANLLYMSPASFFDASKPIRGGVPIIFPWFGPRVADPTSPMHGFARLCTWDLQAVQTSDDGSVELTLALAHSPATREMWNHQFALTFRVTVAASLAMSLNVQNLSSHALTIEQALHTYLAVSDVRQVVVHGLDGATYLDRTARNARCVQETGGLRPTAETDRMYLNVPGPCTLEDPGARRRITIAKEGSQTTVIWNPWPDKARTLPDLGDGQWTSFICIESANAGENALTLAPRAGHTLTARVEAEPLPAA
jgi:glucose-6-phosphate 1-epimerase